MSDWGHHQALRRLGEAVNYFFLDVLSYRTLIAERQSEPFPLSATPNSTFVATIKIEDLRTSAHRRTVQEAWKAESL
jgi:hypothetical protein